MMTLWTCLPGPDGRYRVSAVIDGVLVGGVTRRYLSAPTPFIAAQMVQQAEQAHRAAAKHVRDQQKEKVMVVGI